MDSISIVKSLQKDAINAGWIVKGLMQDTSDPVEIRKLEVLLKKCKKKYLKYKDLEKEFI
jgi:hypothetical protein